MAWIKPTRDDLIATLSAEETDAFCLSDDFTDVAQAILERTVFFVRGFVRSGGAKLPEDASLMPPSLLAPAMDYAAYDILKRMSVEVGEARRRAREDALSLFKEVGAGRMKVEPHEEGDASGAALPSFAPIRPRRRLDTL